MFTNYLGGENLELFFRVGPKIICALLLWPTDTFTRTTQIDSPQSISSEPSRQSSVLSHLAVTGTHWAPGPMAFVIAFRTLVAAVSSSGRPEPSEPHWKKPGAQEGQFSSSVSSPQSGSPSQRHFSGTHPCCFWHVNCSDVQVDWASAERTTFDEIKSKRQRNWRTTDVFPRWQALVVFPRFGMNRWALVTRRCTWNFCRSRTQLLKEDRWSIFLRKKRE